MTKENGTLEKIAYRLKKHLGFLLVLLFTTVWIVSLVVISPERVIDAIGVETGYLLIFLTALLGVSGFVSVPFYTTLVAFISTGNFNVFLLMLTAAPARAFGDSVFFLLGYKGHGFLTELIGNRLKWFSQWLEKRPASAIPVFAYIYTSITPLPQDLLMVILGLGRVPFRWIFVAVLLGNATFVGLIYILISYSLHA